MPAYQENLLRLWSQICIKQNEISHTKATRFRIAIVVSLELWITLSAPITENKLLLDKRHWDKETWQIYIPYCVNSIVAFWAKVQTVLSTGLLGASVVSWTRKGCMKMFKRISMNKKYSGLKWIYERRWYASILQHSIYAYCNISVKKTYILQIQ